VSRGLVQQASTSFSSSCGVYWGLGIVLQSSAIDIGLHVVKVACAKWQGSCTTIIKEFVGAVLVHIFLLQGCAGLSFLL
jgi:hypothetical protein